MYKNEFKEVKTCYIQFLFSVLKKQDKEIKPA